MMKTLRIDRKELRTILSLILVLALVMTPMAMPVYARVAYVEYDANGASGTPPTDSYDYEAEGADLTVNVQAPTNLEMDGHSFAGWALSGTDYDTEDYDEIYQPGDHFNYNGNPATLTAQWTPNLYTVDFEMHGIGTEPAEQSVTYGAVATAPVDFTENVTTVDGYTFRGWFTVDHGSWSVWDFDTTVAGITTLHAAWECTVAYDANNADATGGPVESETTYIGKRVTVKDEGAFEDTDAVTIGWATTPDATRAVYTHGDNFTPDANTTLYAFWAPTCLVTYAAGGGNGTKADTSGIDHSNRHIVGYTLELPSAEGLTAPTGKKFIGWTVDTGTALYEEGDEITLTGDTTITANWAAAYTLSYNADGGSGILPLTKNVAVVSEGDTTATVKAPTDLMKDGYSFWKWNDGVNDYFPGDTITLTTDTALTAVYGKKVTIEYAVNNEGATKANAVFVVGKSETATVVPAQYGGDPTGYSGNLSFEGWFTDPSFGTKFVFDDEETSGTAIEIPDKENTFKLYGKWAGGFPYFTHFSPYTNVSQLDPGVTYLFAYGPKENTDAVFELPEGSAVLLYTGITDSTYANYGGAGATYHNTNSSHTPQGYVKVVQSGHGFDGCPFGGIYLGSSEDANWYYNCYAGGACDVGPFYAYTYETAYTEDVVIELNPDSTYVYQKGGAAPERSDFIVKVKKADDEDYTTLSAFDFFDFDNTTDNGTIKVRVGEYVKSFSFTGKKNHKNTQQAVVATVSGGQSSSGIGASLSGNNATVDKLTNAQVKAVAGEKGSDVRIDISGVDKSVNQITIPAQTVESVANTVNEGNGNKSLTLALPNATVTLDNDAFNAIKDQAEGDLKLVVDQPKQSTLQSAQRTALSEKDVKIVVDAYFVSGGKRLGNFKGGKVTVAIPYTPKAGEDTSKLQAYYIDNSGNMTAYPTTWKDGNTYFDVDHFSHFVVLYEGAAEEEVPVDTSAFIDLKAGAWYMDAVKYCLENGYMKGINSTYFGGLLNTTRAEVATIIWRMEGCPAPAAAAKFTDIPQGKWYSDSVAWGTENGVLLGISDTEFAPDATITREQLTAMFYRYSNLKNKAAGNDGTALAKFKDASNVTAYAVDSMKWATSEGLVNGIGGNLLVPRDFTTRFQLATMIWKYRSL